MNSNKSSSLILWVLKSLKKIHEYNRSMTNVDFLIELLEESQRVNRDFALIEKRMSIPIDHVLYSSSLR